MAVNPEEYYIKDIALLIAQKFGIPENQIKFDKSKPSGIKRMTASSNASWFNFTSIDDGLDKTIQWYIQNFNNVRK